jgi:hypothetical protein
MSVKLPTPTLTILCRVSVCIVAENPTGAIKITHMWDNDGDGQFEGSNSGNTTDISSLSKTGNQVSITNGICWGGKKTVVKIEVQYINGTYSSNIVTSIVPRP